MLAVLPAAFTQNRCCVGLLPSSFAQLLRRCRWCMQRQKGLMPPSCELLVPRGWWVPAAIFQPDPRSLLGWGWWWLWALGAAWGREERHYPAARFSCAKVAPSCFHRSAVALLLVFVQLNLSYLNLLLEKPLCYLKHVLCAF